MILFVDDEPHRIDNDVEELRMCGYEVEAVSLVDEAVKFLEERHGEIDGVICDVMMPHGRTFSAEESREGLRTGLKLFEWTRQRWPGMPFVIFTNVSPDPALWERLQCEPNCIYIEKEDYYGVEFTQRVKALIPMGKERASK